MIWIELTPIYALVCLVCTAIYFSRKVNKENRNKEWNHIHFRQLKPGMTIRVNVGFGNYKYKGVIDSVHTGDDNYVWVTQKNGHRFTASASYGNFEIKQLLTTP